MLEIGAAAAGGTLEYPGEVAAAQSAEMSFEMAGRIIEFPVVEGQQVERGTVLARLDPADFQAELQTEVARRNAARATYERTKVLYQTGAASGEDLDKARRDFEVTAARIKTAEKAVSDTTLRAPFAGKVARRMFEEFQNVQAKQAILLLEDDSALEVKVSVPERDWVRSKPGLTAEERTARARPMVTISSIPDRQFDAHLKEWATSADPVTRTFPTTFGFDAPEDVKVLPGMTARVTLTLPEDHEGQQVGVSLPSNAVPSDESGSPYVWRVDMSSMTVHRTPVTLGELSGTQVQILSGLEDGDLVAISGVHHLREGAPVRRFED
jgi:RND family efflux transporter MFP subunit